MPTAVPGSCRSWLSCCAAGWQPHLGVGGPGPGVLVLAGYAPHTSLSGYGWSLGMSCQPAQDTHIKLLMGDVASGARPAGGGLQAFLILMLLAYRQFH